MPDIEWLDSTEFPEVLNNQQSQFSVDVLIFCEKTDEHTIGWFSFRDMSWRFLCREVNFKDFKWRYFLPEIDKYERPKKAKKH